VDGPGNDFNLLAGSPAIGNGKAQTEPASDFYGKPFSGSARSIGAVEVEINTGIQEISRLDAPLFVYPNPATDQLEVNARGLVEIWNTLGVKVFESNPDQPMFIGDLPRGVYFLRVGNRSVVFVKE